MTAIRSLALAAVLLASIAETRADVFVLRSGGRVQGERIEHGEGASRDVLSIRTFEGCLVKVNAGDVKQTIRQSADVMEHQRLSAMAGDTVEEQWRMAQWCLQRELDEQRARHLQRILELEPNHIQARHALGYSQVRGRWVLPHQQQVRQGYKLYRGRWRLPQEIALLEAERIRDEGERDWLNKLKRLRAAKNARSMGELREILDTVEDPFAVRAFIELLREEPWRPLRLAYVGALGRIGDAKAAAALMRFSVEHADEEVRYAALEEVARLRPSGAVKQYVERLRDADNARVNRAAIALERLQDRSTLSPLIDALVTTHTITRRTGAGDQVTTTFTDSGSSFASGSRVEQVVWRAANKQALNALTSMSDGANFGFDQDAWRRWLAVRQKSIASGEARRD